MNIELAKRKKNPYRKLETGNLVFVYEVNGTPEEVATYKASNVKAIEDKDTKKMLFFSTAFVGQTAELVKSEKGNWYAETNELTVLSEASKLYGIDVAMIMCRIGKPSFSKTESAE